MPEKKTVDRARKAKREGKSASTQAGEFVREEMHHIRAGKHGARSARQAIAIGLSKARRAGVELPPPAKGTVPERTRKSAERAHARGHGAPARAPSGKRSRAARRALEREGSAAASPRALAKQARKSAATRGPAERRKAARKAARTKGAAGLSRAARKAAKTRDRAPHRAR